MDIIEERRKYDISDGIELAVVIMSFIFALVFLLRLKGDVGISGQFQVQNAANLLVASLLTAILMALFLGRTERSRSLELGHARPYAVGGVMTGISAYLLVMFELSPELRWLSLLLGFGGLAFLTITSYRARDKGASKFTGGMWVVIVVASAAGFDLIGTSDVTGLLLFLGLAGVFAGIFGLMEVMDDQKAVFDRFGYSASIFCLLMIWLSTSRVAASGTDGYNELDGIMSGMGVVFGMLGASVLSQRRLIDKQIRDAIADGHDEYKEGEWQKALDNYDKALRVAPDSKIARTCKADTLSQMKRYAEAVALYDSVILEDKDYAPAISGKGSALRQSGELAKSVIYLQKALEIEPDSKVTWNNKGNAFFFLDQLRTAIYCYKKAIELDPEYSGAWYNLAVAYTNSGNFLEADHAFRTAENLFNRREKRPLLRTTGAGSADKRFIEGLQDMTGDIKLEMLMGDVEKRALSHISFNPGATRDEVMEALTLAKNEVKALLSALVKSHLVKSKRDGAKMRYYPKEQLPVMIHVMEVDGGSVAERKVKYLTDLQRRIVDDLGANPGATAKDLAARLALSQQVLDFQLRTLTNGGVIEERKAGLRSGFFLKD